MPDAPYFVNDRIHGRCLDLGGDGTYQSCQKLLRELEYVFGAKYSVHLEWGIRPDEDNEKGYWNVEMFGEEFLLMRHRGFGITLWGPKPPTSIKSFLRVCRHFGADEYLTIRQRIARFLRLDDPNNPRV